MSKTLKVFVVTTFLVLSPYYRVFAADLKGPTQDGAYTVGGDSVRFLAFTYTGKLDKNTVTKEGVDVIAKLKKDNKTCQDFDQWNAGPLNDCPGKFSLAQGDVFVVGWFNETKNNWSWIASDRNAEAFPKFNWLASDGKSGRIDSGLASVEPGKAMTSRWFSIGNQKQQLALFTSAGWVTWGRTK
jgi:hypothetical protein